MILMKNLNHIFHLGLFKKDFQIRLLGGNYVLNIYVLKNIFSNKFNEKSSKP